MLSNSIQRPKTPTHQHYEPHTPSPLSGSSAASSPTSSPTSKASARRGGQYKATTPLLSSTSRKKSSAYAKRPTTPAWDGSFMRGNLFQTEPQADTPQTNLLRERFKQRCFERAQRAREAKVRSGRKHAHYSSEGEDLDMDMEDEDADGFIDDEFYARIVLDAERRRDHSYRVSYQRDVGSSFDPALEDPVEWEQDLQGPSTPFDNGPRPPSEYDEDDADELAALAEDEAYWEALGNTEGLDALDLDALGIKPPNSQRLDEDMDMS